MSKYSTILFHSKPCIFSETVYLAAFSGHSNEMFLIELPKPKSHEVLRTFDNDYSKMCDNLDIQKNRLVILNPNRKKGKKKKNNNNNDESPNTKTSQGSDTNQEGIQL